MHELLNCILQECIHLFTESTKNIPANPYNNSTPPQTAIVEQKADLPSLLGGNPLNTWKIQNKEVFPVTTVLQQTNSASINSTFFDEAKIMFTLLEHNTKLRLVILLGPRWGTMLEYQVLSGGNAFKLHNKKHMGMF